MKFVVSSSELLHHLQAISKVISTKNTLPILDNFLFQLNDDYLQLTASDLGTTLIAKMPLENITGEGSIAVPARILTDTLKEFSDQPLTFEINEETFNVDIYSENGKFSIAGYDGVDFPKVPDLDEDVTRLAIDTDVLYKGIDKTLFATGDDEMRQVMNGIFVDFKTEGVTFVASDSHELVRYRRKDLEVEQESNFILAKKPAGLLRTILPREEGEVSVEFDAKNAFFRLQNYTLVSRLIEGKYPGYEAVIPNESPFEMIADRQELYNTLKRVSVFSNQASNLVKFKLESNQLTLSAQDIDFSISAYEKLNVQYEGDEMEIGFKSTFLLEILGNISSADVQLRLSDPSKAGIFYPQDQDNEHEDILMLLMPMMLS